VNWSGRVAGESADEERDTTLPSWLRAGVANDAADEGDMAVSWCIGGGYCRAGGKGVSDGEGEKAGRHRLAAHASRASGGTRRARREKGEAREDALMGREGPGGCWRGHHGRRTRPLRRERLRGRRRDH